MDHTNFDNLARLLASSQSRRHVLKRLLAGGAGGAAIAFGLSQTTERTGAQTCIDDGGLCQAGLYCCSGENCDETGHCPASGGNCVPDNGTCTSGDDCCSGSCDDSGYCYTPDNTCIEDGGLCEAGRYCCSGANCDNTGHCPDSGTGCVADNGTCTSGDECCSGNCDDSGYCYTAENTCIEDGGLCEAGRYCCSGLDCAPGGHCPTSEVSTLPATGSGSGGGNGATSELIAPVAILGAAAVVGARRLRGSGTNETSA